VTDAVIIASSVQHGFENSATHDSKNSRLDAEFLMFSNQIANSHYPIIHYLL
jgi:hypothetical protein